MIHQQPMAVRKKRKPLYARVETVASLMAVCIAWVYVGYLTLQLPFPL